MPPTYDDAPEVAGGHDLPEAYISPPPETVWSPQPSLAPTFVSQTSASYGNSGTYNTGTCLDAVKSPAVGAVGVAAGNAAACSITSESTVPETKKTAATAGGISLVLVLSIIIAILSAAVIGLAAGTGVATKNYNDANSKLRVLSSSLAAAQATPPPNKTPDSISTPVSTGSSPSSTATDWNGITNGCSDDAQDVSGLIYTSQSFASTNFTIHCNKDTINAPLFSIFAPNFNGCMDACAAWNTAYSKTTTNTCVAVSFVPSWSVVATALAGHAPGDCYLKPGPQTSKNLTTPNIGGGEVHAAILLK
ncbi:hypothetical protein V8C37DRAFT_402747 [Trichoderma ceciliae]